MHGADILVPLFAIIFLFGMPVVAFIVHRVLKHQERIEMIRHGMQPQGPADVINAVHGVAGQPWNAKAAPPPPFNPGAQQYDYQMYAAAQNQLRKGLTLSCVGMALLIGLFFIDVNSPGPWLLGGLIPLFVGIAQIIIAILSGARIGPPGAPYVGGPPPSQPQYQPPPPQQPGAPAAPGPYTYRPGSTVELEPPVPPPDTRR